MEIWMLDGCLDVNMQQCYFWSYQKCINFGHYVVFVFIDPENLILAMYLGMMMFWPFSFLTEFTIVLCKHQNDRLDYNEKFNFWVNKLLFATWTKAYIGWKIIM